jgi:CheY-like chemotaxis protein
MVSKIMIKILIVDNEPKSLSLNNLMLSSSSPFLSIKPFESSTEALSFLRNSKCNFVISNLEMPVIDGLHLIKEAKTIEPEIFSILITEKDISNFEFIKSEFNIDTCIKKPYTFTRLLSEITIGIMNRMGNKPNIKRILQGLKDKILLSLTEGEVVEIIKCSLRKDKDSKPSWRFVPANIYNDWTNIMWENHKLKIIDEFQRVWVQDKIKYAMNLKNGAEPVDKLRIHRFDQNDQLLGKPIIRYFKKDEFDFLKKVVTQHYDKTCEKVKTTRIQGCLIETQTKL